MSKVIDDALSFACSQCPEAFTCKGCKVQKAIDYTDEYGWHNLEENSSDLPVENGTYWVHGIWQSGKHAEGECEFMVDDGYFSAQWNFNVIAWKKVEPFMEV